jgi:hypothetical protein
MVFYSRLLILLLVAAAPASAFAQSKTKADLVGGFRSAKFGMSEVEVVKAIKSDFVVSNAVITQTTNKVEGTHLLKVSVNNLLPNSGQAVVTYSFGYKADKLDEIDVTWDAKGPGNSPAVLLRNGAVLQNYFLSEPFAPGSVTGSALLTNGNLLLFRGTDSAGHAVALFISGPSTHDAASNKINITPTDLTVAYASDPTHPDVFKIQAGAF